MAIRQACLLVKLLIIIAFLPTTATIFAMKVFDEVIEDETLPVNAFKVGLSQMLIKISRDELVIIKVVLDKSNEFFRTIYVDRIIDNGENFYNAPRIIGVDAFQLFYKLHEQHLATGTFEVTS